MKRAIVFLPRHIMCAAVVITLAVSTVEGQQRRGRWESERFGRRAWEGAFSEAVSLVAIPEVQQELGISQVQRELLEDVRSDLRDQVRAVFRGRRRRGGRDRRPRPDEQEELEREGPEQEEEPSAARPTIQQRLEQINRKGEEILEVVLEPAQLERLNQLRLQREGIRGLDRPELIKQLGITDEQRQRIRQIVQQNAEPGGQAAGESPSGRQLAEQQDGWLAEIRSVLTVEQWEEWEKMKGQQFRFPDWLSSDGGERGQFDFPNRPNT